MSTHFTDQLLIAMPGLSDPNFAHSVVYLCAHNEQGALGLVVNRPMEVTLGEVLSHLGIPCRDETVAAQPVYFGGPVELERGFVLHYPAGEWEHTFSTPSGLALTTSRDVLRAVAEGRGPERYLVALGYSGWSAGQLEEEVAANVWLCGPGDHRIVFELPPAERLAAAARAIGVDLSRLSSDVGHA